ncbi:hypothetical protein DBB34_19215, partial [Sphaerisporangium cinnabarinum]
MPRLRTPVEALAVATGPGARGVAPALSPGTVTAATVVARSARSATPARGVALEAPATSVPTPCGSVRTVAPRSRPGVPVPGTRPVVARCAVLTARTARRVTALAPRTATVGTVPTPCVGGPAGAVSPVAVRAPARAAARPVPSRTIAARAAAVVVAPT